MEHVVIPLGERHAPHNWEYADTAARTAAIITDGNLINSVALQLDTGAFWRLAGIAPVVWEPVTADVYAWAKAPTKPSYTATEVGLGNVPNLAFSGSNTGDETTSTIKTKLGVTVLSGDNTGDQTIPTVAGDIGAIPSSEKAAPSGVATLDGTGLIPVGQAATGTADVTKFLRGDRVWAVPGAASGGGLGTLECYDAAGARDDVPVAALSNLDALTVNAEMVLGAACDIYQNTSGNFGWRDNIQSFALKATANNAPTWGTTIGNFEGYVWSASAINQAMVDFHVDHDYALGTVLYPHVHFRPLTAGAGVVRWGFEFATSKGHGQQVGLPATTTVYVNFTVGAGNLGTHYVAEVVLADAISSLNVEPDSVIHVRVFRDAANAADTYAGTVWAWQADLHYQFARLGTLNRAPNFYG